MHQKKSELQIGKESTGISSDYNHHPNLNPNLNLNLIPNQNISLQSLQTQSTAPYKRPLNISKSPTLYKFPTVTPPPPPPKQKRHVSTLLRFRRVLQLRHLRLALFVSLPLFYFVVSRPTNSVLLDFLSAFSFSAALLLSLNLAIPRIPSLLNLRPKARPKLSLLPVFFTARAHSRPTPFPFSVVAYTNGDVYEGEFNSGKCSGSGVYYYSMSGRYEGDWLDGKYHGFGVETWARGSRYRGQYRHGLRHGFGVYRFYTGDVYAGEWASGQSHGCGVHTCEDGSRYVGEFKWGVKHGLGHYHFSLQGKRGISSQG